MQTPTSQTPQNGLDLAGEYWRATVAPILATHRPRMPRAAARVGTGSDVLGLDDVMSRDHDWGLRLQVFVPDGERDAVTSLLDDHLPETVLGLPTRFAFTGQDRDRLALDVLTVDEFVSHTLGFDPRHDPTVTDWLSLSGQAALEITAGEVFEDTDGGLTALRDSLAWWPDDVWRYALAADWQRLDQELPLLGRAADRGDALGSRVIAARLVDVAMHLGFLLTRTWAPYSKWRGTVWARLPFPGSVTRALTAALDPAECVSHTGTFASALQTLADTQAGLGLPVADPVCVPFWDRPYLQIAPDLVPRLLDTVTDPAVRALPPGLGTIEQRTDNVDVLTDPERRRAAVR